MHDTVPPIVCQAIMAADILYKLAEEKLGDTATAYLRFPRDIEKLVSDTFYLPIRSMTHLTLHEAEQYLCIRRAEQGKDRRVNGLLHVGPPATIIFLEAQLKPQERNYVIAHEVGHYIHDIFMVKQLWLSSLQDQKAAIESAFSWQSLDPFLELQAFIKGLPNRPRTITARGDTTRPETRARELFANAIALELLAPWHEASALFHRHPEHTCKKLLRDMYGVPSTIAAYYYDTLQRALTPEPDFFTQLFTPLHQHNAE